MTNLLAGLTKDTSINDGDKDVLGGGFNLPESGVYDFTVKYAYLSTSKSGAVAVNVVMEREGYKHTETLWVRSGTEKGGHNYYVNANGEKKYLPGFILADTLCELITGKGLAEQTVQNKLVSLYNREQGKEVPTEVPVLMELVGKPIKAGMMRVLENKRQKDQFGNYVDTAETREYLEVEKFFAPSGHTLTELKGGAEPAFIEKWAERWSGEVRDRRTIKDGVGQAPATPAAGAPGGGFQATASAPAANTGTASAASPGVDALFG